MIGNNNVHIAEICRDGESVSIISSIAQFDDEQGKFFTLIEPFLIKYSKDGMNALYIPSTKATAVVSEEFQFEPSLGDLHPRRMDAGNFKDAKTRFYPVITWVDAPEQYHQNICNSRIKYILTLFKISVDNEQVNITVVSKLDLLPIYEHFSEQQLQMMGSSDLDTEIIFDSFCANSDCCAFTWGLGIYYIRFATTDMKLKFVNTGNNAKNMFWGANDIFLVQNDVFYSEDKSVGESDSLDSLLKINFDEIPVVDEVISVYKSVFDSDDLKYKYNTEDIVGGNLYKCSNNDRQNNGVQTTMVFLDKQIEKNHPERETVFDRLRFGDMPTQPTTLSEHVEGTTVFPTRLIPSGGSCLIDVAYVPKDDEYEDYEKVVTLRFQVYNDDETFLQSEINQCLFGT